MEDKDIRWIQRYNNFSKALGKLANAVELAGKRALSELENQGLIQVFEFTHELAWNTMKDFLTHQGNTELYGSKDTTREAFRTGLITEGEIWMDMISSRNKTSHTYNEATAAEIIRSVLTVYYSEFQKLQATFSRLAARE